MTRFNYHQGTFEQLLAGASFPQFAKRIGLPMAIIGVALLLVVAAWSAEQRRLGVIAGELSNLRHRAQVAAADDSRAERLIAIVAHMKAVEQRVAVARRDVLVVTNTIAQIGNELPPQTWLTAVESTPAGDWTINGRSTRIDEIGTMLRRVQGLNRSATARLISIAATGRTGRILDFVIDWERRP